MLAVLDDYGGQEVFRGGDDVHIRYPAINRATFARYPRRRLKTIIRCDSCVWVGGRSIPKTICLRDAASCA